MTVRSVVLGACLLLVLAACAKQAAPAATGTDPDVLQARARQLVQDLADGKADAVVASFDDKMKQGLTADKLRAAWASIGRMGGALTKVGETHAEVSEKKTTVHVRCVFEKGTFDAKVVYDRAGKVAGLWFTPVPDEAPATGDAAGPSYARKDAFTETDVTVGSGQWQLPGTLTMPVGDGPFPAVVLVHGSGPHDRDETVGGSKVFRDLAWGLASKGVAVLRYEKRTKAHGAKMTGGLTVKEETVDDAVLAAALLRTTPKIDGKRVVVVGHSLGGYVVPRILAADPQLAGAVVLAGNTRGLEVMIGEQLDTLANADGTISDEEKAKISEMQAELARLKDLSAASPPVLGVPATYWLDLRDYDAPALAARTGKPLLVLQGERDYQVTMVDFGNWQQALAGCKACAFKSYPELNHLFVAGTGKSTPDEYQQPGFVAQPVVDDVAAWVLER
jgi:alpha-beta hydrolase superfamily lysophospholipase